jgi:hypothetical protein
MLTTGLRCTATNKVHCIGAHGGPKHLPAAALAARRSDRWPRFAADHMGPRHAAKPQPIRCRLTLATGLYAECFIYFISTFSRCIFIAAWRLIVGWHIRRSDRLNRSGAGVLERQSRLRSHCASRSDRGTPPATEATVFLPTNIPGNAEHPVT